MRAPLRHLLLASCLVAGAVALIPAATPAERAAAADPPWTLPTSPATCTNDQINAGDVQNCVLMGSGNLPEANGWPMPPFPAPPTDTDPWVDLTLGATGTRVTNVQQALVDRGASLTVDGVYGQSTVDAVTAFQTAQLLTATGTVDATTATQLGVWAAVSVLPWVNLASGSTGPTVVKVQQALQTLGYILNADGQYGSITTSAVTQFQTSRSLPATGIVDQATADALGVQNTSAPPFPPPGWKWLGWAYNGSPVLTAWERRLVGNPRAIGPVKVNQLRSLPDAQVLFDGFIADIVAGGYVVKDVGTYAFRCTSSTRKDCYGLTRSAISNHSYGLAMDMNTAANPQMTYFGINGATACATPVTTDLPKWVVDTAQKWGLYWGGYGWSSGCQSPTQWRTSVTRDSMHFEFRGTPAQARLIAAHNIVGTVCVDTADNSGAVSPQCIPPGGTAAAGSRLVVTTGAPTGATAAMVNITLTRASANGYATAEPCTATAGGERASSNGNVSPGKTVANVSVVPIDSSGKFCLYLSTAMAAVVDVQGYFAPSGAAPSGSVYYPAATARVIDTRTEPFCLADSTCPDSGPLAAGSEVVVPATGAPDNAVAVLANLTAAGPLSPGYLTADTCTGLVPGPQTRSNSNFAAGATTANLAVVPVEATAPGAAQFCAYTSATTQLLADVQGWFAPVGTGGLGYTPVAPSRLVDTRKCWTDPATSVQQCAVIIPAGSIVRVQGPVGASAVLVNITLTGALASGYATAAPCSTLVAGPQTASNGNVAAGGTAANTSVVAVDPDGTFCVYVSTTTHVVVDLQGTFAPAGQLRFLSIAPIRKLDTRYSLPS